MDCRPRAVEVLDVNSAFWQNRRVLLTGHTGFKGSWLALWLQRAGADVLGISLAPPTAPSLFELARVGEGMESRQGDVRDQRVIESAVADHRPEVVMHLAAQALVRRSYEQPLETYSANVLGTATVLEALRGAPSVRTTIVVTSDKCYENDGRSTAFAETDPLGGADPYSSSKGAAEIVTAAYRKSYFSAQVSGLSAIATARAGNVVGGGDWAADRLVPDVMQALLEERSPVIRSPESVRPWQHVLDCLNGYLTLAERMTEAGRRYAGPWNFGPDPAESRTVRDVVEHLCGAWTPKRSWVSDAAPQPAEARYLQLDSAKARTELGWAPRLSLPQTLQSVVDWYQAYARAADMRAVTLNQIASFEQVR